MKEDELSLNHHYGSCVLGTAAIGGVWGRVDPKESIKTILLSLELGVRALDTAPAYGDAELFVGKALKEWKGIMPQISTKAGRLKSYRGDEGFYDYTPQGIERSVLNSLRTLGVSSINLLFLHEPDAIKESQVAGAVEKLQDLKQKGYVESLGIGGNSPPWFSKYITSEIFDVAMEFNRLDVCCIEALDTSLPQYKSKGIKYYAASPLHMGLLGSRFDLYVNSPPAWMVKKEIEQAKYMHSIARQHGMSLSTMAHRFLLTISDISGIVVGASDRKELVRTLNDFKAGPLPPVLYQKIINHLSHNQ